MEITEVRVRLVQDSGQERLRAFATITFDNCFVVREIKVIEGDQGLFVAMPSRKAMSRCRNCGSRNVMQANYCNQCGEKTGPQQPAGGREKMYLDVAHPINSQCRSFIHKAVVGEYQNQLAEAVEEDDRKHETSPAKEEPVRTPSGHVKDVDEDADDDYEEEYDDNDADYAPDFAPVGGDKEDSSDPDRDDSFDKGIFA